jgi:hypothetical protein
MFTFGLVSVSAIQASGLVSVSVSAIQASGLVSVSGLEFFRSFYRCVF